MANGLALRWGLLGFVLTVVRGLCSSVGFEATLHAAMLSLAVMYGLGWLGGNMWRRVFRPPIDE